MTAFIQKLHPEAREPCVWEKPAAEPDTPAAEPIMPDMSAAATATAELATPSPAANGPGERTATPASITDHRKQLQAAGYAPIPLYGKEPPTRGNNNTRRGLVGWQKLHAVSQDAIESWARGWPDAGGTGLLTRLMPTFDIDILDPEAAEAVEQLVRAWFEERGRILVRIGRPPKRAIPCRTNEPFEKITRNLKAPNGSKGQKIELLADGQQMAAFGTHPETGKPYIWHGGEPGEIKLEELPNITAAEAQKLIDDAAKLLCAEFGYEISMADNDVNGGTPEDWVSLIESIRGGDQLHDSTCAYAAKLIVGGLNGGAATNLLRAEMEVSTAARDERWQERYDDIPRAVATAEEKFGAGQPDNAGATPLKVVIAATLADKPVPPQVWHVPDIIPARTVTNVTGDGGNGKSLLILQLSVATELNRQWLGHNVRPGPVIYLSAEDEIDEAHRRLDKIAAAEGMSLADMKTLHILPYAGLDAVLAAPAGRSNRIEATPLWHQVKELTANIGPKLVVFDTQSDVFAGEENARAQARQFVGMLRGLAIQHDLTSVLISHPSLSGIASGSGSSGSTGWNNAVRSRWYLDRVLVDGIEADSDLRILTNKKSNYGRRGYEMTLRWVDGVFVREGGQQTAAGFFGALSVTMKAETTFLDLLGRYEAEGRIVGAVPAPNYAPAIFARDPRGQGVTKRAFLAAMNNLFQSGRIAVVEYGSPSRRRNRLALVKPAAEEAVL